MATTMAQAVTEDNYYLLERDSVETERLDTQHEFLVRVCGGSLLHKAIPQDKILSVADVATGTGIWLRDLKKHLDSTHPTTTQPRVYHGFDVSDAQFPVDNSAYSFSLQDCLKPFPVEHHGKYDLVHVRLLVAAIKGADFKLIVANLKPLLKPGGYLQWEDLDLLSFLTTPDPKWLSSPGMQSMDYLIHAQIDLGSSGHVSEAVAEGARIAGLVQVQTDYYNTNAHPELEETTRTWILEAMAPLLKNVKMRNAGAAADEQAIDKEVQKHAAAIKESYAQGLVIHGAMGVVLAKMPEQ